MKKLWSKTIKRVNINTLLLFAVLAFVIYKGVTDPGFLSKEAAKLFIMFLLVIMVFLLRYIKPSVWMFQYRHISGNIFIIITAILFLLIYLLITTGKLTPEISNWDYIYIGLIGLVLYALFRGIYFKFQEKKLIRKTPWLVDEVGSLTCTANIEITETEDKDGRILLLKDRLVFISEDSYHREIQLKSIQKVEIEKLFIVFPMLMTIELITGEFLSFGVSLPYFWKREIINRRN